MIWCKHDSRPWIYYDLLAKFLRSLHFFPSKPLLVAVEPINQPTTQQKGKLLPKDVQRSTKESAGRTSLEASYSWQPGAWVDPASNQCHCIACGDGKVCLERLHHSDPQWISVFFLWQILLVIWTMDSMDPTSDPGIRWSLKNIMATSQHSKLCLFCGSKRFI